MWNPLEIIPKKALGVDIGTYSIKVVEISRRGERRKLENYGEIPAKVLYQKTFRTFDKNTLTLSIHDISRAIVAVVEEAKIKTRDVIFSIPDFSTFFTTFWLPPMTEKEIPQAVEYEAHRRVPLPLEEVTLDWQIIDTRLESSQKRRLKILLVTVPNEVINQYREIAEISGFKLMALEAEAFGLLRSLVRKSPPAFPEKIPILIIDIGAQSTTCNIVDAALLKMSYSFDISGNELTAVISRGLGVDYLAAEDLKKRYGISSLLNTGIASDVKETLLPLIDLMIKEIEKVLDNFYRTEDKEIEKIIIAGASAFLPGLVDYFQNHFKKETRIAYPFSNIFYPPILENTLKEIGPSYSIAVGAALRGLE